MKKSPRKSPTIRIKRNMKTAAPTSQPVQFDRSSFYTKVYGFFLEPIFDPSY